MNNALAIYSFNDKEKKGNKLKGEYRRLKRKNRYPDKRRRIGKNTTHGCGQVCIKTGGNKTLNTKLMEKEIKRQNDIEKCRDKKG